MKILPSLLRNAGELNFNIRMFSNLESVLLMVTYIPLLYQPPSKIDLIANPQLVLYLVRRVSVLNVLANIHSFNYTTESSVAPSYSIYQLSLNVTRKEKWNREFYGVVW